MSDVAIRVEGLGKQYRIGGPQRANRTFREALLQSITSPVRWLRGERNPVETFWALDNVSFEIKQGDAVGIIGRNGAGKSTLLKVLSRITKPTKGRVDLYGRVASLLEVGTGFHSELSGRDNIYLNGAILGMRRQEIDGKFDEIVDFSGVEKFLDVPVKHYSSGMHVRLAFAVAAHLEPEILVVDEVLAVGDAQFQKKSLGKMAQYAESGRTVLFVSHNMPAVSTFCKRAILLESGSVKNDGTPEKVISAYLSTGTASQAEKVWLDKRSAPGNSFFRYRRVAVLNVDGNVVQDIPSNQPFDIQIEYWNLIDSIKLTATVVLFNEDGQIVFSTISNHETNWHGKARPLGLFRSTCRIPNNLLSPGQYEITVILCADRYENCVREDKLVQFTVYDEGDIRGDYFGGYSGIVRPKLAWHTEKLDKE